MLDKDTMNSREFSNEDLCSIIESCSRNGVADLEYGGLKLSFKENKETVKPIIVPSTFHGHERVINEDNEVENDLDADYPKELELEVRAIEAQNALLADPFLAEQLESMGERTEEFMQELERNTNERNESTPPR